MQSISSGWSCISTIGTDASKGDPDKYFVTICLYRSTSLAEITLIFFISLINE